MRVLVLSFELFVLSHSVVCQVQMNLNANDANATLRDDGIFFSKTETNFPGYEIPVGSGNHTNYSTTFFWMAFDSNDSLHCAFTGFDQSYTDIYHGPIADDYQSVYYLDKFDTAIWSINRDQINFHVSNYMAIGYVPIPEIANWPGNGNLAEGVASQLAPYVDVNSDLIYNPMDGDFPYIQGDAAVYVILNDAANSHNMSGGTPLGIEVHAMFYQYASSDDLNNTTFLNVKFFNRSDTIYHDLIFSIWMDSDIGNATDDYVGCDSSLNLSYTYNGDSNDQGGNGQPGYGLNPPAFGVKMLNDTLGSVLVYNNSGTSPFGMPANLDQWYNAVTGHYADGSDILYSGSPTKFVYNGNPFLHTGWNEFDEGNVPYDRRTMTSSKKYLLTQGSSLCFDYAFVFNQAAGNALENVNELLNTASFVQDYYDNSIQPCNQIFLEVEESEQKTFFSLYPNPSDGQFTVSLSEAAEITIFNISGEIVFTDFLYTGDSKISPNINSGIYLVKIHSNNKIVTSKIVVQ